MAVKMSFAGLRERLKNVTSHDSEQGYTPPRSNQMSPSSGTEPGRHHVPFIASPLDPKTTTWLNTKHESGNLTLKRRATVAQAEANRVAGGIFRKQHEASPLELFFDLFFVANLAVFTYNHKQTTVKAVGNYVGFFSLLWSFWFHISIHDVRFYVDSIANRFLKFCQFAMFSALTGLAPIYSVLEQGGSTRAFRGVALVFMLSRLTLLIQYSVVLWFVRPFKKTLLPMALTMLLYFLTAMAFLITYLTAGADGPSHVYAWYIIIGIEMVLTVAISSIWRILSFKHTHLVERVGLLTLIVMGEGVIGVIKSIAYILDGTSLSLWESTGRVIGPVSLIYLVFIMYFTPIAHERFGSVRQQFWTLLHLPLHIAIVLTEEGSSATLLWVASIGSRYSLVEKLPSLTEPSVGYPMVGDFINKINGTLTDTAVRYTYLKLKDSYNWYPDLNHLKNITSPYASSAWNEQASEILHDMVNETSVYFFENFKFEIDKKSAYITDANQKLAVYYQSMTVIFTFFFIAAGALLIVLGAMYWLGKNDKTWEEYVAIISRFAIGIALPFVSIVAYNQPWDRGFMFFQADWIISIVVFCYLAVVMIDNTVQKAYDKRYHKKLLGGEDEVENNKRHDNGTFGPSISHETSELTVEKDCVHPETKATSNHKNYNVQAVSRSTVDSGSETYSGLPATLQRDRGDSGPTSDELTLTSRRQSEQPVYLNKHSPSSIPASAPSRQQLRTKKNVNSEWQTQPLYHLPRTDEHDFGRETLNNEHKVYDGNRLDDIDIERGQNFSDEFRNESSFEMEPEQVQHDKRK